MSVREMDLTPVEYTLTVEKIAKLNARAAKRGWNGHITITGEPVTRSETMPNGLVRETEVMATVISGSPPCYDGWTFLARLEWADGGLVVFTAPGVENVTRPTEQKCDHCGINRQRNATFVVRHDDGREFQVGSTCLKDFLGWNTNPVWVSIPSDNDLFDEGGFGRVDPTYSVLTVLAAAWAVIEVTGYVRTTDYGSTPTKGVVRDVLDPFNAETRKFAMSLAPKMVEAESMAIRIRDYILSDAFSGSNEYVTNLKNLCRSEFVDNRFFGFLVSAPQAWAKGMERDLIRKAEKDATVNEFLGELKERLTLPVTLKSIRFIEGFYGTSDLYTFATDDGHIVKWFSSRTILREADIDRPITLTGTVKKHETFREVKSTVLTRCKVEK